MKAPEELIQKYMDGVLSPEEDAELRTVLTDDELSRIKTEKGLYDEILKRIAAAPPCPQLLWEHIRERINSSTAAPTPAPVKFPNFLSFAAMLIIGFGVLGLILYTNPPGQSTSKAAFISNVQFASTMPAFAAQADFKGETQDLLENLRAHGFGALDMKNEVIINGHKLKPLGIKYCSCSGKAEKYCSCSGHTVAQFLFDCCGKPVVVLVSTKDAPIGAGSFNMDGIKDFHISSTEVGNFKLVGAGTHSPDEVLKVFTNRSNQ